jgi:hypothetical protein
MQCDSIDKSTLFYLIGFQRSGTTLLCHLLDKHHDIVCDEEPEVSKRITYKQFRLLKNPEFDSIKKTLDFYEVPSEKYTKLVDTFLLGDLEEDSFLRKFYALLNKKGATCVGAKEVCDLTAHKYDFINRLVDYHDSRAKFVFLERDIKGVVNSFIKLGFFPPGKNALTKGNTRRFAKRYIECLNATDRALSSCRTHYLTFRNLMNRPENELTKIYAFLGVDSSERTVKQIVSTPSKGIRVDYKGILKQMSDGWRANIGEKESLWLDRLYTRKRKSFFDGP